MHVAAWYRRTHGLKFTKIGELVSKSQTPNAAKFRRVPTKSVPDIWFQKMLTSVGREKLNQSLPNSLKTCYGPMPVTAPNFIALGQTMYEKRV